MIARLAHIMEFADAPSGSTTLILIIGTVFVMFLAVEHTYVKHGRLSWRLLLKPFALAVIIALAATLAPLTGQAQDSTAGTGLPDLISDPPRIWATQYVDMPNSPDGQRQRVMLFDGHIHNIGQGPLEISGNPQIEGDVQQRVFDGAEWTAVSTPTVQYETDDGHNHFHLANAVEYSLWDITQGTRLAEASKVGFCLVDTEQREEGNEAAYLIEQFNYCSADDPDTESLTMGISPGWRDTYDATITFQWVDVSSVPPGFYWVGALTDPEDQIVESNEDNNDLVFSSNSFAVDGYRALPIEPQTADEPITLRATTYGTVGKRAFVISDGPTNGTLDVPVGVDLTSSDQVRYTPDPGFVGDDSFEFYVHDVDSPFPTTAIPVAVTVTVDQAGEPDQSQPSTGPTIVDSGPQVATLHEEVELQFTAEAAGQDVQWFGSDLPPGLSIDRSSGQLTGVATFAGTYRSTIVASSSGSTAVLPVEWTIEDQPPPSLLPMNSMSTASEGLIRLSIGAGSADATYEADGLPDGILAIQNAPLLSGVTQEIGTFNIEVRELVDGEVVDTTEFTWTIRSSTRPSFPL